MTPEQALALLDEAVSAIQVNRATHVRWAEAVRVLRVALEPVTANGHVEPVES